MFLIGIFHQVNMNERLIFLFNLVFILINYLGKIVLVFLSSCSIKLRTFHQKKIDIFQLFFFLYAILNL